MEELKWENSYILEKYYWEEVQTDIYDITSGNLVQSIDVINELHFVKEVML